MADKTSYQASVTQNQPATVNQVECITMLSVGIGFIMYIIHKGYL